MKRCPACKRVESDDALAFCRADGTALVGDSLPLSGEAGTAKLRSTSAATEIDTSVLPHSTNAGMSRATAPTTVLRAQHLMGSTRELTKSSQRKALIVMA